MKAVRLLLLALSTSQLSLFTGYPSKRPIIGILLETVDPSYEKLCGAKPGQSQSMQSTYKSYVEQAGAGAVPIFLNQADDYYNKLFKRINGVLIPGGGVDLITSPYGKVAYQLFKTAKVSNDKGNYFPIWGTCLGMQEMTTWPLNPRANPLTTCNGTEDISLSLNFTSATRHSRIYNSLPAELYNALSKYGLTPNYHHYCLSMKRYQELKELNSFYMVTSTNNDANGKVYASTIEAYEYPFYGIQFHPEKNNFWPFKNHLNQTELAVKVSQYLADFLIKEASKSKNSFSSYEEEGRFLLNNYHTEFNSTVQAEYYCLSPNQVPKFDV